MATTLWTSQLVQASNYTINANEPVDLLTSATISNASAKNSLKVSMQFDDLKPTNALLSGEIGVEVDFKDDGGNWRLLPVYQGNWLRKDDQAPIRVIIMQPNVQHLSVGETDIQLRGPLKICETNRHQGTVPAVDLRVRVVLVERTPGGTVAWDEVKVTGEIELYDTA